LSHKPIHRKKTSRRIVLTKNQTFDRIGLQEFAMIGNKCKLLQLSDSILISIYKPNHSDGYNGGGQKTKLIGFNRDTPVSIAREGGTLSN